MIIQLCGLSGSGKSTLSGMVRKKLEYYDIPAEIIDGDDYRRALCRDLVAGVSEDIGTFRSLPDP